MILINSDFLDFFSLSIFKVSFTMSNGMVEGISSGALFEVKEGLLIAVSLWSRGKLQKLPPSFGNFFHIYLMR